VVIKRILNGEIKRMRREGKQQGKMEGKRGRKPEGC
jgi:hypothetical protein